MKKNKGFTLIELLAVILILGIIALIAIPTVNNVIAKAKKGAHESTGNAIVKAAETYAQVCQLDASPAANCPVSSTVTYTKADLENDLDLRGGVADIDTMTLTVNTNNDVSLTYKTTDGYNCTYLKSVTCTKGS